MLCIPIEVRQHTLRMLPSVATYRYSLVAKRYLKDVKEAANTWQYDITLTGEITTINFKEGDQTVHNLLLQKLKVETIEFYYSEFVKKLPKDMQAIPMENLVNRLEPSHPVHVVCDYLTKKYNGEMLEEAFRLALNEIILEHLDRTVASTSNVVQPVFARAVFNHPNAKEISSRALMEALVPKIGVLHGRRHSLNLADGPMFIKPPSRIEYRECRIPKLIFSHPNAAEMKINEHIGVMLICAVRYRNLPLVRMILRHPSAKSLLDGDLNDATADAEKVEEEEIVKTLRSFKKRRAEKSCTVS